MKLGGFGWSLRLVADGDGGCSGWEVLLARASLPLLLGPGGESGKRHCCRCLQMFADVLLALAMGPVTSEPWLPCQPQLNRERKPMLNFLLDLAPARHWRDGQVRLGATGAVVGCPHGGHVLWVGSEAACELRAAVRGWIRPWVNEGDVLAQGMPWVTGSGSG